MGLRQAQAAMAAAYGARRSVGQIWNDLHGLRMFGLPAG
jgi:hypothetical protein